MPNPGVRWQVVLLDGETVAMQPGGGTWDAFNGAPDPYLDITELDFESMFVDNTLDPVWNETVTSAIFPRSPRHPHLPNARLGRSLRRLHGVTCEVGGDFAWSVLLSIQPTTNSFRRRNPARRGEHYPQRIMKKLAAALAVSLLLPACAAKSADNAPIASTPAAANSADRAGTYSLSSDDFTASPDGCRTGDDHRDAWSIEMGNPADDAWAATERYGEHSNPYSCTGKGKGFSCTSEAGFDYTNTGKDADVKLDIRYDGSWSLPGTMNGNYELAFTCQGSECADVAEQWGVASFPCANEGTFEGTRG